MYFYSPSIFLSLSLLHRTRRPSPPSHLSLSLNRTLIVGLVGRTFLWKGHVSFYRSRQLHVKLLTTTTFTVATFWISDFVVEFRLVYFIFDPNMSQFLLKNLFNCLRMMSGLLQCCKKDSSFLSLSLLSSFLLSYNEQWSPKVIYVKTHVKKKKKNRLSPF